MHIRVILIASFFSLLQIAYPLPHTVITRVIQTLHPFLQVSGLPVYGVGNPTIDGVRRVLRRINDGGRRPVLWQNMREEPVVYVNGKPFVLREVERPFKNMLEYTVRD